ncbi:transmembrane protein 6/97 [Xylariaceae sp. FL0594]|nr:transmembrane protein 6/97 [Xylariaceae sp. FL0594]
MGSSIQAILNRVYLVYFLIHIPILFCVDLVPFYPSSLWEPAGSPFHALGELRSYYYTTYNDQFFLPSASSSSSYQIPTFFPLFAFLELVFHLPVSVWAVRALWTGDLAKGKGSAELLLLVYGLETALTTATCMYEAALWDPSVVTWDQKVVLVGGLYGGYFALAAILSVDMYTRLLSRVNAVDAVKKTQ